eukprot:6207080-Pleurochrysis_carterae.AAC.1
MAGQAKCAHMRVLGGGGCRLRGRAAPIHRGFRIHTMTSHVRASVRAVRFREQNPHLEREHLVHDHAEGPHVGGSAVREPLCQFGAHVIGSATGHEQRIILRNNP